MSQVPTHAPPVITVAADAAGSLLLGGRWTLRFATQITEVLAGVPDGVCLGLVSGAASNFQGVRVGTAEVMDTNGFNPGNAAAACTGNPTVVFTSN